ncbi:MAG: biotin-dependent carboxyltransferase family protein [Planctomycetes bacterium]|nr:biotin-dependent carboxyltransferase family protein [Planctomycetota bacterium]
MSLVVFDPGLASRVVDFGRPQSRSLGVPVGVAADRSSLALGNALLGNPPEAPALEICLKGPIVRAEVPVAAVLFGAPFSISSSRQPLEMGTTFALQTGEEIHFGSTRTGLRAYLCVTGGFACPEILGSRSALECVTVGATLSCQTASIRRRFCPSLHGAASALAAGLRLNDGLWLRVTAGLQASWFNEREFFDQEFTVTPALDRMGVRLQARPLTMPERELISEPVGPGTVQVTRDGQCIVLGMDGQTIGGYPKIAQVIQTDWDALGQLRPGDRLRFQSVTLEEAGELYQKRQAWLREWVTRLRVSLAGI